MLLVALALLASPFVVLAVRTVMSPWLPTADIAATELRVRAVGGAHTPLLGVYSRYGWNHPGPLLFYVLAVTYRVLGSPTWGLLAGAVLINGIAVGGCALLLWRRGGVAGLVLGSIPLVLLVHALGGTFLQFAWNPYVIVLGLFALALVAWSVACGDWWLLPVAVAIASFCVQAHVGSLLPAVALVGLALVAVVADARRARVPHPVRLLVVTAVVGVGLWLPAIIEELGSGKGNLTQLWDFWTSKQGPTTGFAAGARLVLAQLGVAPPFVTGHESVSTFTAGVDPGWTVPVALVLLLAATAVAFARRDRVSLSLDAVALTLIAAAWLSAAHIVDVPYFYIVRWLWIVGAIAWLAIGWTTARAVRAALPRRRVALAGGVTAGAAIGVILFLVGASTVAALRADPPDAVEGSVVRHIDGPTTAALRDVDGTVLVRPAGSFRSAVLARGLVLSLNRGGVAARLDPVDKDVVGSQYVVSPRDAAATVIVASDDDETARYSRDPRYRELSRYDKLTRAERVEYTALAREIDAHHDDLVAWVDAHPREWARSRVLGARAVRGVVFERR